MYNDIIMITSGHFPEGDAGAVRLYMIGKALNDAGFKVTVLCRGEIDDSGWIKTIRYYSLRSHAENKIGRIKDYAEFPKRVKKFLLANPQIGCVYIYNAQISIFRFCKEYCVKQGIALVHDCVEWYSPEQFKLGRLDIWYRIKNYINTTVIDQSFSVIAISHFLENYYKSKNIHTTCIPILCDSHLRRIPKAYTGDKLTLLYAGVPGKKDLIGNLLEAFLLLSEEEKRKVKIILIGASREYLIRQCKISAEFFSECGENVEVYGRMSRDKVLDMMEHADLTLLPRDASMRYAQAGFPSKVVESLANATPILCNLSSDLGEYLKDGRNAILAESHCPEHLADALRRAIRLTPEEKMEMSKNALATACQYFDYRYYITDLKEFILECRMIAEEKI